MVNLKRFAGLHKKKTVTDEDREDFKTIGFDPNELLQLKEMNHKELTGLMIFCGIHVFNGVPLLVLEEDEMRMAYLIWRAEQINQRKLELAPKWERGIRWLQYIQEAMQWAHR